MLLSPGKLLSLNLRSNRHYTPYKREGKKADENLATEIGQYISLLVTCWETFLRDIFIFTCQNDQEVAKRIKITLPEEIADKITVAEYYASNFHFQSLHSTVEALNFLNDKNGQQITDHMGNDFFNNIMVTSFPVVFLWVQEKWLRKK